MWTRHESRDEWGAYPISYVAIVNSDLMRADGYPITSPSHLFDVDGQWVRMDTLGKLYGRGQVVALHVEDAKTYVVGDRLSHNKAVSY